ncbi:unnamed protein product [Hymenolepis diminuta]|uniref:Uncharacterized protein n=1 Tax=Hymenolepis diminuta TaxID=6216 RepID=A0A564YEI6_HYMDI|nr:unnamed protein product [Hymenolepis diminuta]
MYNLPLLQSNLQPKILLNLPHHRLARLDPNSLAPVAVEELPYLPDWPTMHNNQLSTVFTF